MKIHYTFKWAKIFNLKFVVGYLIPTQIPVKCRQFNSTSTATTSLRTNFSLADRSKVSKFNPYSRPTLSLLYCPTLHYSATFVSTFGPFCHQSIRSHSTPFYFHSHSTSPPALFLFSLQYNPPFHSKLVSSILLQLCSTLTPHIIYPTLFHSH